MTGFLEVDYAVVSCCYSVSSAVFSACLSRSETPHSLGEDLLLACRLVIRESSTRSRSKNWAMSYFNMVTFPFSCWACVSVELETTSFVLTSTVELFNGCDCSIVLTYGQRNPVRKVSVKMHFCLSKSIASTDPIR